MIESLQRIEFIRPNGTVIVLLNFTEDIEAEIPMPMEQQVESDSALFALWATPRAGGAARSEVSWIRYQDHSSFREVRSYCAAQPARIPLRETGKLRIHFREPDVQDDSEDEIWEFANAVPGSCVPSPVVGETRTATSYRFTVGERRPIKGSYATFGSCGPAAWNLIPAEEDTMIVGAPACMPDAYIPPALYPEPPPVLVPASGVDPGNPPILVPPGTLDPGAG